MKRSFLALALLAILPMTAMANLTIDLRLRLPKVIIGIDARGFMQHSNGRIYMRTPEVCGLTKVQMVVTGDNLIINDLDVLFGDGTTQDLPTRQYFRQNSTTNWKPLVGMNTRCIIGFSVKATPDRDWNNARVTLFGMQQVRWSERPVNLGSALIRDFGR